MTGQLHDRSWFLLLQLTEERLQQQDLPTTQEPRVTAVDAQGVREVRDTSAATTQRGRVRTTVIEVTRQQAHQGHLVGHLKRGRLLR